MGCSTYKHTCRRQPSFGQYVSEQRDKCYLRKPWMERLPCWQTGGALGDEARHSLVRPRADTNLPKGLGPGPRLRLGIGIERIGSIEAIWSGFPWKF